MLQRADAHARMSDPVSSEIAVVSIGRDLSIRSAILRLAERWSNQARPFTDTMLTDEIEKAWGTRQQRNVIARSRGLIEREGLIERVGLFDVGGRPYMHFQLVVPTGQGQLL